MVLVDFRLQPKGTVLKPNGHPRLSRFRYESQENLPHMKHLGDVSKIDGGAIQPVDIISFGSPCTDLSIAGKREGLVGPESSLFFSSNTHHQRNEEQDQWKIPTLHHLGKRTRAYNSHKGRDFKEVLEQIIGIKAPHTTVPMPEKNKWPRADLYMGDGWSLLTVLLTHNIGEFPNVVEKSSLSQILEVNVPENII